MSAGNSWHPTTRFLREGRGKAEFETGLEEVRWSFLQLSPIGLLPLQFIRCDLKIGQVEASGSGDSFSTGIAMKKALAEAWERAWMFTLPRDPLSPDLRTNSNGMAAGPTAGLARRWALNELCERSIFLRFWQEMNGYSDYELRGLRSKFLKAYLTSMGWNLQILKVVEPKLGFILVGFATHPDFGAVVDSGYVDGSITQAEMKLIRNLLRSLVRLKTPPKPLPEDAGPAAHRDFYLDAANLKAFEFLRNPAKSESITLGGYDQTNVDLICDVSSMPAVARATNPHWPKLTWGRKSIAGRNEWPHPLA